MKILNIPRKLLQITALGDIPLYYSLKAYRNWKNSGDYIRRQDPFKMIWISPENIVYNSRERFSYIGNRSMYADCGKVVDGDWDLSESEFKNHTIYDSPHPEETIYKSLHMRFAEGLEWEETPLVRSWLQKVRNHQEAGHQCRTESDVLERFQKLDLLYTEIRENGYKSKKEIYLKNYHDPLREIPRRQPALFRFLHDEVVVNIGRSGNFLFVGGHHRLSMALIAGVKKIPVRIFVRHHNWQERIDRLYLDKEGVQEEIPHPDLAGPKLEPALWKGPALKL